MNPPDPRTSAVSTMIATAIEDAVTSSNTILPTSTSMITPVENLTGNSPEESLYPESPIESFNQTVTLNDIPDMFLRPMTQPPIRMIISIVSNDSTASTSSKYILKPLFSRHVFR